MTADILHVQVNGRFLTQRVTGVQRYSLELMNALDGLLSADPTSGVRIEVLVPDRPLVETVSWRSISLRRVGRLAGHAWEQLELPRHVTADILFCPGNVAPIASLLGSVRTCVTVHDLAFRYFPKAYGRSFRIAYGLLTPLVFRFADRIVTVSDSERRRILEFHPSAEARLVAIANGGMPPSLADRATHTAPYANPRPFALYLGSMTHRKNLAGLVEAAILFVRRTDHDFIFAGAREKGLIGPETLVPAELAERIHFLGRVDDTTMLALYRAARCFVFPSFYEASGLPLSEAMALGCPVVASDIPALRERCGDAALYCDPDRPAEIAERMTSLALDDALRERMREKALTRATAFTWHACAEAHLAVWRSIVLRSAG